MLTIPRRRLFPALFLLVAGCSGSGGADAGASQVEHQRAGVRIVVVTHGQASDPFWSIVSNGAHDAGRDMDVRVEYQAPTSFSMVEMSDLIEAAVASRPAGLVVSIPDPDALAGAIRGAVDAGIPVLSINSGGDASAGLGALAHIGLPEYDAGVSAGRRMAAAGVVHALCVNHEVGNAALDRRCDGFRDGLEERGGRARVLAVDLADPDDTQQRVAAALAADPDVDGLLTLGPAAADPVLAALARRGADLPFATFDLTPQVLEAVRDGHMLFAIDQQPYLQGYLPVVLLVKYRETRTLPGGGHVIASGPRFVTADDAEAVLRLSREGIR